MSEADNRMEELADRVERARAGDRELDCLIWCALNGVTDITYPDKAQEFSQSGRVEGRTADGGYKLLGWIDPGKVQRNWSPYGGDTAYPAYTKSLDAAMSLVPEGLQLAIYTNWPLTAGYPCEEGGWITITDDMPRGCWVRSWGGDSIYKNVQATALSHALAITALALRARALTDPRP